MPRSVLAYSLILCTILLVSAAADAQRTATLRSEAPRDLAAQVAGTYVGDVISDARGSSQSGVTVTVTRVGPNLVEVRSDYSRIPTVRIRLTQAMSAIVQADADHVFLIDRERDPRALTLTIDDASLSLRRQ